MTPSLVLLHGALGSAAQLEPLAKRLGDSTTAHLFDFEGHGDAPPRDRPYRTAHFAQGVLDYLDAQGIERARCFGYSMGGYVALYLASEHPSRVERVMTLATKFRWTPEVAAREGAMLDAGRIAEKVPQFARMLEARHQASGWTQVLERTRAMMESLGESPELTDDRLTRIEQPVRIAVGDRDTTVSVEESAGVARLLRNYELEVIPRTPHPFEKVPLDRLARSVADFLLG